METDRETRQQIQFPYPCINIWSLNWQKQAPSNRRVAEKASCQAMLRLDVTDATLDLFVHTSVFMFLNFRCCKRSQFAYHGMEARLCLQMIYQ